MITTPSTQQTGLSRLHQLLDSNIFTRTSPDNGACEPAFAEVIQLLDDLLQQSEQSGRRIDFINEVGVNGRIQDITSLVSNLHSKLIIEPGKPAHFAPNEFNCYYDAGTGYFANGFFFSADHNNEAAFFVDDQRIYLNRHIKRALQEIEQFSTVH